MITERDLKPMSEAFSKITGTGRYNLREVFNDWLEMCICALAMQKYEQEYLKVISKYKPEEVKILAELFGWFVNFSNDNLYDDPLGTFYEFFISRGDHGQFFTPMHICDMMAAMAEPKQGTICDPCVGAGRTLLAGLKIAREADFNPNLYGADIDHTCVKMSVVNLSLYGVYGEIAWMDSLNLNFHCAYQLRPPTLGGVQIIKDENQSEFLQASRRKFESEPEPEPTEPDVNKVSVETIEQETSQQVLF